MSREFRPEVTLMAASVMGLCCAIGADIWPGFLTNLWLWRMSERVLWVALGSVLLTIWLRRNPPKEPPRLPERPPPELQGSNSNQDPPVRRLGRFA